MDLVRLACVKHAASVRPEPGSNSPSRSLNGRLLERDRPDLDQCCTVHATEACEPAMRRAGFGAASSFTDWHSPIWPSRPGPEARLDDALSMCIFPTTGTVARGHSARPHWLFRPLFRFQGARDRERAEGSRRGCAASPILAGPVVRSGLLLYPVRSAVNDRCVACAVRCTWREPPRRRAWRT